MKCENSLIVLHEHRTAPPHHCLSAILQLQHTYFLPTVKWCRLPSFACALTPAGLRSDWLTGCSIAQLLGDSVTSLVGCWLRCCKKCQSCDLYRKINDFYSLPPVHCMYISHATCLALTWGTSSYALRTTFLCKTPVNRHFFFAFAFAFALGIPFYVVCFFVAVLLSIRRLFGWLIRCMRCLTRALIALHSTASEIMSVWGISFFALLLFFALKHSTPIIGFFSSVCLLPSLIVLFVLFWRSQAVLRL